MATYAASPQPPLDEAQMTPFEDSTALLDQPERLHARSQRDGYLFFGGLLDPEPILQLRRAALDVLDRHGLLAPLTDPLTGKLDLARLNDLPADQMRVDIGVTEQIYFELQQLPELHKLPHHPQLLGIYRVLFGEEVFVHPRHIMRAMTPHPATGATPPHQDFSQVQGSADTWTCWFPIGGCDVKLGPLAILRGSHRNGYLPVGTGGTDGDWTLRGQAQLCDHETDWVGGDFAIGDVLTFQSFTVHRSLLATVRDEVRISMDVRYQRASDAIEARSLTNHSDRPWEEVYQGWSADYESLKYYWEPFRLSLSSWDASLLEPGARRIC